MRVITEKQREVLGVIERYIADKGYAPSIRDIAEAVGHKSSSSTHGCLSRLRERGYIQWRPERPRTIRVIKT